jgi:hypothetical protein
VTKTATTAITDAARRQLKMFFEDTKPVSQLLATLRSRRVARGYSIESGIAETRAATGHTLHQGRGPLAFVSDHPVLPLTEVEEAIIAWAACGPNGMVHTDIAVQAGFNELTWVAGRTAAAPGNSFGMDLLVIKDGGAYIYNPGREREKMVEIEHEADYEKVVRWYRGGMHRVLDHRPDIDWGTRIPGLPNALLFGPYQFNVNREGTTWFIPINDLGWFYFSALLTFFDAWHFYLVDEATQRPAGLEPWIEEGKLELPVTISQFEQGVFQNETFPAGSSVQNMRLAAEAMGLGNWIFCGYIDDVLMGAYPEVAKGLEFRWEPRNPKAPLATGALKVFGVEGIKEATYVPSPRYANGRQLIEHMVEEKYGTGGWLARDAGNWMLTHGGPFKPGVVREIVSHEAARVSDWAVAAATAYVDYCVDRYGQCPVYLNPMHCDFGAVIHHVDEAFYERYYVGGSLPTQIREHLQCWH